MSLLPVVVPTGNPLYWALMLLVAWPIGYLSISINSCIFYFTGKLIKGKASFKEIRSALYWASLPSLIFVNPLYAIMMYLESKDMIAGFGIGMMLIPIVIFAIWNLILLLRGLSQVQRFSIWKVGLSLLLIGVFFFAITFIITLTIIYYVHGLKG